MVSKEERIKKVEKLKEISKVLKTEFIGLDGIIDQIMTSISPWYVTPEVIERPVVISLWGMTGTGKSSVVRRLITLLDKTDKTLFLDCGEKTDSRSYNQQISDDVNNFINGPDSDDRSGDNRDGSADSIFVFDEFQYAKTLNENGCEIDNSTIRPVWSLLDSGKLDYSEWVWGIGYFKQFIADLGSFCSRHGNCEVSDGILSNPTILKEYVDELGYYFYNRNPHEKKAKTGRNINSRIQNSLSPSPENESTEEDNIYSPINIIQTEHNTIGLIYKEMNKVNLGEGTRVVEKLYEAKTLGEIYNILTKVSKIITTPRVIDCHKSLIFVIGNLDEAFRVEGDMNPDMSADIFNDITSKVTIQKIKESLGKRFRAEQVARLGNNLIKYPTLRSEHFLKIIEKELNNIFTKFEGSTGIKVTYGDDVRDLAYSEGVFPTQGVRPVFTTISSLLTPVLSEVISISESEETVNISTRSEYPLSLGFRIPKIVLILKNETSGDIKEISLDLQLGALRYPKRKLRNVSASVHEVGHAILNSWFTGNVPVKIVSTGTDEGGFCDTFDPSHIKEIDNIQDICNDVMISLGGYLAEKLVFGDEVVDGLSTSYGSLSPKILMGSGSDLKHAWESLSYAAYDLGLFECMKYTNLLTQSRDMAGVPYGLPDDKSSIKEKIINLWRKLEDQALRVLGQEKKLLKEAALVLSEDGSMNKEKFTELIKLYGNKLTTEHMEQKRNEDSFYIEKLKAFNV